MKLRTKDGTTGVSLGLNVHAMSEVVMGFDGDGGADSMFIKDLDVQLASGEWMDLGEAFRTKAVITDNYNTTFREPANEQEKAQGWY
jgi:hypothetical protein